MNSRFDNILSCELGLTNEDSIVVGVSAGPDSISLLHMLVNAKLSLQLMCVYIDHGLRPHETAEEIVCVQEMAQRFDLDHKIVPIDVRQHKEKYGTSLEESGRILRYMALEEIRREYNAGSIAVAHTADDQAEEILLRLFRGTALKGLSGMQFRSGKIIRPLLSTWKKDIYHYLQENDLRYCLDSSNHDRAFLRNRMRLDILPHLERYFNPSIQHTLCRTASVLATDEDYLDKAAREAEKQCLRKGRENSHHSSEIEVHTDFFNTLHLSLQRRIAEKICHKFSFTPSYQNVDDICTLAQSGRNGSELHLPQGVRVYKTYELLLFQQHFGGQRFRGMKAQQEFAPTWLSPGQSYRFKEFGRILYLECLSSKPNEIGDDDLLLDTRNLTFPLLLRSPRPGDRFTPKGMTGSKKISRFLSDQKIPKTRRSSHPVIISEHTIVAIVPLRVDQHHTVTSDSEHILHLRWQKIL